METSLFLFVVGCWSLVVGCWFGGWFCCCCCCRCCAACSKPVFGDQLGKYEMRCSTKSCCSSVGWLFQVLKQLVVKLCFFDFILSVSFFSLLIFFIPAPCSQICCGSCKHFCRQILKCFGSSSSNSKQRLQGSCGCGNFNATAANKSPVFDTSALLPYSVSPT